MFMMTLQISKFVDSPKTQKSKYLENELFFLHIKKLIHYTLRTVLKGSLAEVTCDLQELKNSFSNQHIIKILTFLVI